MWIQGDGSFYYSTFSLADPHRFVIDLPGVINTAQVSTLTVAAPVVDGVRLAQFRPQPDLVSRVVVDLFQEATPEIQATDEGPGGRDIEEVVVAAELLLDVAHRVERAALVELVDGDQVGEVEHVDLLELGRRAVLRRHHVE